MNLRKKFIIYAIGLALISTIGFWLFGSFITRLVSNPGKLMDAFVSTTPVFSSGNFSEDGNYFAYTYAPEVVKPDVDANITMRGFSYPTYFQIMETSNGRKLLEVPYESAKGDQMYVVWTEGDFVWLMQSVHKKGNRLALYDVKANKFRFEFGDLEKLNPAISWQNTSLFFINSTAQKGLLLEANDKRHYRIDPSTGKAENVQGELEMVSYNYADAFQVSDNSSDYSKDHINGSRQAIISKRGKTASQDDFIEVNFLTLTKNRKEPGYADAPTTYYKNNFFVLSPVESGNNKDMELAMLDKNTLKTVWKLQIQQKELKTFAPRYGFERFFIKEGQLLVTNGNYLIKIDLDKGVISKTTSLYP